MIQDPILLVDDEEDLRSFLKDALTQDGYLVDEAPDARTALAIMAHKHYPVVLTDLNMPGGPTGFDLIAAVKAKDPGTLCVVITGYASMETAIQAVKFGAYDFVQKPFKLAEIEAVLDRALNHAVVVGQLLDYQKDLEGRVLARVKEIQELHDEMRVLNGLLVDSQSQVAEEALLVPFLDHLRRRFHPDAYLALLPGPQGWTLAAGNAPARLQDLPSPASLEQDMDCAWEGMPEGHLVPLRSGGALLGALYVGFRERSTFHPQSQAFTLWRRQLEAALSGLHRTRTLVEAELARVRSNP